jgi:hypothetical protein
LKRGSKPRLPTKGVRQSSFARLESFKQPTVADWRWRAELVGLCPRSRLPDVNKDGVEEAIWRTKAANLVADEGSGLEAIAGNREQEQRREAGLPRKERPVRQ